MALTHNDAKVIMGMLVRGDANHDIAAWFGVNPARVAEVKDGSAFGVVSPAPAVELPPKGAIGPKARKLRAYASDALLVLREKKADGISLAIKELEDGLKRFDVHEA